jgi:hypothetical protein
MTTQAPYPRVTSVKPLTCKRLQVIFAGGKIKIYDCRGLIDNEAFRPLASEAVFRNVHVDPFGYGIMWNDEIDLAESELWLNGKEAEPVAQRDAEDGAR